MALTLLDDRYLEFSAEATALESELGSRFTIRRAETVGSGNPVGDQSSRKVSGSESPADDQSGRVALSPERYPSDESPVQAGEAFLRWHQVYDLLTVYYFNLKRNFRGQILKNNSVTRTKLHSGLDLRAMVQDQVRELATPQQLHDMRVQLRRSFLATTPVLARAILYENLKES